MSNDVLPLAKAPGIVWAALLTPQGKYLADFFVVNTGDQLLLDINESLAAATVQRLSMYKLRSDVQITPSELTVTRGLGTPPDTALYDPRDPSMGWRAYGAPGSDPQIDWDEARVANIIPESGVELIPNDSYILEHGFERLNGVNFRKGCYVGQEVTARMKHKTELRKGLVRVGIDGAAPVGSEITFNDRVVGRLFTQSGGLALAWLRLDQPLGQMQAGRARIWLD